MVSLLLEVCICMIDDSASCELWCVMISNINDPINTFALIIIMCNIST